MSLISEALKRARLEAARRDGQEKGAVYSEAPVYLPQRRGLGRGPALALLAAGLVAGGAIGAALLLAGRGERNDRPATASIERPAPASTPSPVAVAAAPAVPAPTVLSTSPPEPASSAERSAPAIEPDRTAPPGPPRRDDAVPRQPSAPAGNAPAKRFENGGTYLRSVVLPGGQRLELDGIVASTSEPLTMINRQLLGLGESVDGFTIETIDANQVTLRSTDGVTVHLQLRPDKP